MASAELFSLAAPSRIPLRTRLLLAALGLTAGILVLEGMLRIGRFEYHLMPAVQFGWPDPQTIQSTYARDPDFFWVTRDYRDKLRAARRTNPDVVFMGDSCTEFGTYPALTLAMLAEAHAPVSTGTPLATGGWSSEQGLAQMKRDIVPLHPKIAVIYYGWNDHWIALGPTDPVLMLANRLVWLSDHLRIMQVALKAAMGLSARNDQRPNRVPPARYRENLMRMTALARDAGIRTVLVTAPSNHVVGHEPQYLLRRHVRQLSDVVPLHQQYVVLTRAAAHDSGGALCDAAAEFAALPGSHDALFRADGIHFTPEGDERLARIVSRCIIDAAR